MPFPAVSGQMLVVEASSLSLSDGAHVATIADSSPNAATGTAASGHQPVYKATGINGHPALECSFGSDTFGDVEISFPDITAYHSLTSMTLFAVVLFNAINTDRPEYFLSKGTIDSFQHVMFGFAEVGTGPSGGGGFQNTNSNDITYAPISYSNVCDNSPHLLAYVYDAVGQTVSIYVDGLLTASATGVNGTYMPAADTSNPFVLGDSQPDSPPQTCLIGSVALFDRAIAGGSGDFETVQSYLATEYGLTLPTAATQLKIMAPSPASGTVGVASGAFTAGLVSGVIGMPDAVTPTSSGGTFTPASVNITPSSPSGTFTFTPSVGGSLSVSASDSIGLEAPSPAIYMATGSFTLTGPSNADAGQTIQLTLQLQQPGTASVTLSDNSAGGTFGTNPVVLNGESAVTANYTLPASPPNPISITAANGSGLSYGGGISVVPHPALVAGVISAVANVGVISATISETTAPSGGVTPYTRYLFVDTTSIPSPPTETPIAVTFPYTLIGLDPSTAYYFEVGYEDANDNIVYSNQVNVTMLAAPVDPGWDYPLAAKLSGGATSVSLKVGDTLPPVRAILVDGNGVALDLSPYSGTTVNAALYSNGALVGGGACAILNTHEAEVEYLLHPSDVAAAGVDGLVFKATLGGTEQTFSIPETGQIPVTIQAN